MRAARAGLDPQKVSLQGSRRRIGTREEPSEVQGAVKSRACVRGDEAEVRVREGTLPRASEKRKPAARHLRDGQSIHGAQETALSAGVVLPEGDKTALAGRAQRSNSLGRTIRAR